VGSNPTSCTIDKLQITTVQYNVLAQQTKFSQEIDIYGYDKRLERTHKLLKRDLSAKNYDFIKKYDQYLTREARAKAYRLKSINTLLTLSRILKKDWDKANKEDIENIVTEVMNLYSNQQGQETNTTADCKKYLKMFFRWLKLGSKYFKEVGDPTETKPVRIQKVKDKLVREELITDDDFTRLIHAAKHPRTRALIAIYYDGGARPGEALSLKIKHVKQDKIGFVINVDGKTGARPIRLIKATPYLAQWLNEHPIKNNPDAPLFCQIRGKNFGKPLNYEAARNSIGIAAKDAGLEKRVFLNLFRHSEATQLANFMTEAQLRKRHGWSPTSKMPGRYVHLINADVEDALLKHYGITKEEQTKQEIPTKCPICEMVNPIDAKLCSKCGKPLDLKTALENEEKEKEEKKLLMAKLDKIQEDLEKVKQWREISLKFEKKNNN